MAAAGKRGGHGEVPLEPFREAFAKAGLSIGEVARRAGLEHSHTSRLVTGRHTTENRRDLGPYSYRACSYRTAVKLAEGLGLDPFEAGI